MSESTYDARTVRDAQVRAWRTFWAVFGVDIGTSVMVYVVSVFADFAWTREYWVMLSLGVAKAIFTGAVTYFARKFIKPANL